MNDDQVFTASPGDKVLFPCSKGPIYVSDTLALLAEWLVSMNPTDNGSNVLIGGVIGTRWCVPNACNLVMDLMIILIMWMNHQDFMKILIARFGSLYVVRISMLGIDWPWMTMIWVLRMMTKHHDIQGMGFVKGNKGNMEGFLGKQNDVRNSMYRLLLRSKFSPVIYVLLSIVQIISSNQSVCTYVASLLKNGQEYPAERLVWVTVLTSSAPPTAHNGHPRKLSILSS